MWWMNEGEDVCGDLLSLLWVALRNQHCMKVINKCDAV